VYTCVKIYLKSVKSTDKQCACSCADDSVTMVTALNGLQWARTLLYRVAQKVSHYQALPLSLSLNRIKNRH